MSVLLFLIKLFKPKNLILLFGLLFNLLITYILSFIFFYIINYNPYTYSLIFVFLNLIMILFLETSVGDLFIRNIYKIKYLEKNKENDKYYKLLDNCKKKINKKFKHVELAYIESNEIEAYSIGLSTIVLTKGLMNLSNNHIESMMLKELINLKLGNGLMRSLVINGNPLFKVVLAILFIPLYIIAWIIDYIIQIIKTKTATSPKRYVGNFFNSIYNVLISLFTIVLTFTYFIRNYYNDYEALKKYNIYDDIDNLINVCIKKDINDDFKISLFNVAFNSNISTKKKIDYLKK